MDRTIPSTEQEQLSIVERLRQEGRDEGRRQVLLALLAKRLGDDVARKLAASETTDQLEKRLMDWVAPE
ncbi:MAG TPA: hypothetical protein VML75_07975 [Kofleriaceae bacterium]|nr:hypothetical protein [Kofleriaceae bacterium]